MTFVKNSRTWNIKFFGPKLRTRTVKSWYTGISTELNIFPLYLYIVPQLRLYLTHTKTIHLVYIVDNNIINNNGNLETLFVIFRRKLIIQWSFKTSRNSIVILIIGNKMMSTHLLDDVPLNSNYIRSSQSKMNYIYWQSLLSNHVLFNNDYTKISGILPVFISFNLYRKFL